MAAPWRDERTVYVLGAGASAVAGAPVQADLLAGILDPGLADDAPTLDDVGVHDYQLDVLAFIEDVFGLQGRENAARLSLEDLLTVMDRAVLDETWIKGWNSYQIDGVRRGLVACLVHLMRERLRETRGDALEILAQTVVGPAEGGRPPVIVSLNWDLLMDNALWRETRGRNAILDYGTKVQLDGTHRTSDGPDEAAGPHRRVKLLKLHGSLNWLVCPQCDRLSAAMGAKIAYRDFYDPRPCMQCDHRDGVFLRSLMMTPTLLKDLQNLHLQRIWAEAGRALAEADRIVFAGYSFPVADFEFRYLLARHLPTEADVVTVLLSENPQGDPKAQAAKHRYESFFGASRCTFFWEGLEDFVRSQLGS